ncbi:unnamed protein product [Paramecium sonneborni]|uniref:Uncharacterized protein n=1 Tax=Paramecium sonneborni TaxID=65129 RepID=A0A8S1Q5V4_9CILI|nr:unnamed protein product [Paramecium sonneborni]
MIRFISVRIKPQQDQNNLDILVDNNISQQYFIADQNLMIEAEFGNTIIQEIILHLSPIPEKDILYKCFNLNELNHEYKIISGKLIKIRTEPNYIVYEAQIRSEVPYTRLTLTIQNNFQGYFQIYYFGVRGKNIEEDQMQQEYQESIEKKNVKVILKPGRKSENFNNKIVDNANMTPKEFFNRIKNKIPISNREREPQNINFLNQDDDQMKIEQPKIDEQNINQFNRKQYEESKAKDYPDGRKYITLQDDDENSVQFIEEKVKQQQIQQQINKNNHFSQQKCCFSDSKPYSNNKIHTKQLSITKFTSQQKQSVNPNSKTEYNVFQNMTKYTASEIDQEFLQFHKAIEESRNVPAKYRLIHKLNTQQY